MAGEARTVAQRQRRVNGGLCYSITELRAPVFEDEVELRRADRRIDREPVCGAFARVVRTNVQINESFTAKTVSESSLR